MLFMLFMNKQNTIKHSVNVPMTQLVFDMKRVCQYIRDHPECSKPAFRQETDYFLLIVARVPENTNIEGDETLVRDVSHCLKSSYDAYHADYSRPLPYEQYELFITVCRGWGNLTNVDGLQQCKKESVQEYRGARLDELLGKLRELLMQYDPPRARKTDAVSASEAQAAEDAEDYESDAEL